MDTNDTNDGLPTNGSSILPSCQIHNGKIQKVGKQEKIIKPLSCCGFMSRDCINFWTFSLFTNVFQMARFLTNDTIIAYIPTLTKFKSSLPHILLLYNTTSKCGCSSLVPIH
jgi:hypothetical protein